MLRDWLAKPDPDPADLGPVDEVYSPMPDDGRASFGYFLGRLLDQHGLKEKALKYHGDVIRIENGPHLTRPHSSNALRGYPGYNCCLLKGYVEFTFADPIVFPCFSRVGHSYRRSPM